MKRSAQMFKALSEEIRLRTLLLLKDGELCVCDLMAALDLPQSTISRHLAYLRNTGWVEDRRQGLWTYYRLHGASPLQQQILALLLAETASLPQAKADLEALRLRLQNRQADCCASPLPKGSKS